MTFNKIIRPLLVVSAVALTGCTSDDVISSNNFALKADFAGKKATQTSTTVTVKPNLGYNGQIESVDVTAFGVTANFTLQDIVKSRNPFVISKEVDGEVIELVSAFAPWREVFNIDDGGRLQQKRRGFDFESHSAGFIIKRQADGETEKESIAELVMDPAYVTAFVIGNETDAENVGKFAEQKMVYKTLAEGAEDVRDAKAYYVGRAAAISIDKNNPNDIYTISGRLGIEANFTQGKIKGEISDLHGHSGTPHDKYDNVGSQNVQRPGQDQFQETIIINETDIDGNSFNTDLSVVSNGPPANTVCAGECEPQSNEIDGFFNSSEFEGKFYGEEGEEVGGTFTYDAEKDFTKVYQCSGSASNICIPDRETSAAEKEEDSGSVAVGVFSGTALNNDL